MTRSTHTNSRNRFMSEAKPVKAWCLFFNGDPEIHHVSHSRAKVMQMAEKSYRTHWSVLRTNGYDIRMVWISERYKGVKCE